MPLRVPTVWYPCASNRSWKSFMLSSLSSTIRTVLAIRPLRLPKPPWPMAKPNRPQARMGRILVKPYFRSVTERQTAMTKEARINRKIAENLAIQALSFMASDPERLGAFLAATGIGPEMIRKAAADPAFLAGVLDHVC